MPDESNEDIPAGLAAAAKAAREGSSLLKRRDSQRTTLNINDPTGQAGSSAPPDELGELLVERGLITRHQLFNALNESYHKGCELRAALLAMGYVEEAVLAELEV